MSGDGARGPWGDRCPPAIARNLRAFHFLRAARRPALLVTSSAQEKLSNLEEGSVRGRDTLRVIGPGEGEPAGAVEIALPEAVRARAEEIVRLSRRLGDRGAGFKSPREVLAPALVYGLAHMQERYSQAALRSARGAEAGGSADQAGTPSAHRTSPEGSSRAGGAVPP